LRVGDESKLDLKINPSTTKGDGTKSYVLGLFNRDIEVFSSKFDLAAVAIEAEIPMNDPNLVAKIPNGGILIVRVSDDKNVALFERLVFVRPPKASVPQFALSTDKKDY
jgi:hypothetical protein